MTCLPRPARVGRLAAGVLCAAALMATVSGCAPDPAPTASPSASANGQAHTPGTGTDPSSAPGTGTGGEGTAPATPSSTPTPPATPVSMACSAMLTDKQLYAYNPNVSADPDYAPADDLTKAAKSQKGTACGWLYQSSNEKVEMAVARPATSVLSDLKDAAAASSRATPAYGNYPTVEGYFARSGKTGRVQVFVGGYWIVGSSMVFFEPGDAAQLVQDIMDNLKVG